MKRRYQFLAAFVFLISSTSFARSLYEDEYQSRLYNIDSLPYVTIAVHNVGKMAMTVSNTGIFGASGTGVVTDPFTGQPAPSLTYPKEWGVGYLYEADIWVGAIVGRDTLVSTAGGASWGVHEFWPLPYPEGDIKYRSTNDRYAPEFDSAVSQQDFVAVYTDTIDDLEITGYDSWTGRSHRPLRVEVTQRSYAWGYDYTEDFIIVDFQIGNIEYRELRDIYIGLYVDNDIGRLGGGTYRGYDDICGFKKAMRSRYIAGLNDTLDVVWAADNNGDPDPDDGTYAGLLDPTSVIATKVLRTPSDEIKFNFNWWAAGWEPEDDWGPRRNTPTGVRRFHGRLGTPLTDGDKYYVMATEEFDYDQTQTYYDRSSEGWLPPPENAYQIANGAEIRYLLSFGPFNMKAGDILPLTVAFVGGQDFYPGRNFNDLQLNTLWASWVYDNPGIDTDGDGFKGIYHIFCRNPKILRIDTLITGPADTTFDTLYHCLRSDTLYYKGDGVPDFKGARPPLYPEIETFPRVNEFNQGEIVIHWNGYKTETTPDQFSQKIDFEGYRVYHSRSGNVNDFTLVTSFDIENYDRYEYDSGLKSWAIKSKPFTMKQLRQMYGEEFDLELYFDEEHLLSVYNVYTDRWESFFFTLHDWNQSDLRDTTRIHKLYPDQTYPSTLNLDTARMFYPHEVTEEGQLKYFEYQCVLKNLLPSVPYYVSVTAFDHGVPGAGLAPLETNPAENAQREFAQNSSSLVKQRGLDVIVYPNPYRMDGNYRRFYEGWERPDLTPERSRTLHFTNLPNKCVIRIFSIDGDLIREIVHDYEEDDPGSMHETWDLVSRNEMAITSGIYYYSVESEMGSQIGKFVIIY